MLHICRDFISLPSTYLPQVSTYLYAIFMRRILLYTVVGNTNFNIDSASFTLSTGTSGIISADSDGRITRFTPNNGYVVSSSDYNRIICIRSTTYPLQNSGLWRVTSVDTVNNQFIMGLRGEPPVVSTGVTWSLHPAENSFSFTNGINSFTTQYRARTAAASQSRLILQSPHPSQYQVRLTYENSSDVSSTGNLRTNSSIAPGYGGDTIGDFPVGGLHLHGALYYNVSTPNSQHTGLTVGIGAANASGMCRFYLFGEDSTGTMVIINRTVDTSCNLFGAFGLPEDEEYPNDTVPVRRLFVHGCSNIFNGQVGSLAWMTGVTQSFGMTGVAYGYSMQPIFCHVSPYCYMGGQQSQNSANQGPGGGGGPRFNSTGGDNPFLGKTELQTVDLVAGTQDHGNFNGEDPFLFLEPRRLGRYPIARLGRYNFGDWTTTTDGERTWLHTTNGVYVPWYGSILP